jgi:hypothetical protein
MIRNLEMIENFCPCRLGVDNHEYEWLEEIRELAILRVNLIPALWNRVGERGLLRNQTEVTYLVGGKAKLIPKRVVILMKSLELAAGVVFVFGSRAMEPADGAETLSLF